MAPSRGNAFRMADQTIAKYLNELRIFTMLRTQGPASRAEIARHLDVTAATITRLVNGLIERGFVNEMRYVANDQSSFRDVGRPSGQVSINPQGAFFFGVEIGVGAMRFALVDLAAKLVSTEEILVARDLSPEAAVEAIAGRLAELEKRPDLAGKIRSVGVTVPGIVTSDGFVINLPILGWKSVDLLKELSGSVTLPCFVENNANAAAFGAVYMQPSLPRDCTIFMKLGTGCGGAVIVNGRLLRGANGTAGEFGHIRLSETGAQCSCGQHGCLETLVNLAAIARGFLGTDRLTEAEFAALPQEIVDAVNRDDPKALATLDSFVHWLGLGIVSLINIFNPSTVVLGGVLRPVIELCIERIRERVRAGIISGIPVPDVLLSELGRFECAAGAATIAHHHAFDISRVDVSERDLEP
jgi:N-acetylglucosamine repressor